MSADLIDRLLKAEEKLRTLESTQPTESESLRRLSAKREGVALARSYAEEELRTAPAPLVAWLVEIAEKDWDYDRFQAAIVVAESAEAAEALIRSLKRYPDALPSDPKAHREELWIESPAWDLKVSPAPTEGLLLVSWHAG